MNKRIINCPYCEKKIRIPDDKHIRFSCTGCLARLEYMDGRYVDTVKKKDISFGELPRIFGILIGALSLFRLSTYLFNWEVSKIMELIVTKYESILAPIKVFFSPVLLWVANRIHFQFPEWWPHFFVIWLLIGAVTVRAGVKIDEKTGNEDNSNFILRLLATFILSLMGGFLLVFSLFTWIRHRAILHFMDPPNWRKDYVSPFKILIREILFTISATILCFVWDAFGQ